MGRAVWPPWKSSDGHSTVSGIAFASDNRFVGARLKLYGRSQEQINIYDGRIIAIYETSLSLHQRTVANTKQAVKLQEIFVSR